MIETWYFLRETLGLVNNKSLTPQKIKLENKEITIAQEFNMDSDPNIHLIIRFLNKIGKANDKKR